MLSRHEVDVVVAGRPPADRHRVHIRAVSPNTLVVVGSPEAAHHFEPMEATWRTGANQARAPGRPLQPC